MRARATAAAIAGHGVWALRQLRAPAAGLARRIHPTAAARILQGAYDGSRLANPKYHGGFMCSLRQAPRGFRLARLANRKAPHASASRRPAPGHPPSGLKMPGEGPALREFPLRFGRGWDGSTGQRP